MNSSFSYALSLFALSGLVVYQSSAEVLPAPVVGMPQYYYQMDEEFELTVDFPVPMVKADAVGKPAQPGVVKVSHADDMELVWVSESRLRVKPKKLLPALEVFQVEVLPGTKGLKGEPIPTVVKKTGTTRSFYGYSTERCANGDVFLRADNERYAPIVADRVNRLYFTLNGKQHPVKVRPATVADALENWTEFKALTYHRVTDDDRAEAASLPPDEEIPNTWVLELPGAAVEQPIQVEMPETSWDEKEEAFVSSVISYLQPCEWKQTVRNTYKSPGLYELELMLDMPASATTAEALIKQFRWELCPVDEETEAAYQPMEWRDGALRAQVNNREVVITPGELQTRQYRMVDGSEKSGCTHLNLVAETGGLELRLRTQGLYEGIVPLPEKDRPEVPEDVTVIRPQAPYLYTDVCASQMQLRGSTTIRCRYGRVEGGRIRLWKLGCDAEDAVQLLTEYGTRYTGERLDWDDEEARKKARAAAELDDKKMEDNRIDTSDLPGVQATVERPLAPALAGEVNLQLSELFPDQPVGGFYMVEVEGTPMRNSKNPCFNQGLVQVTDLGLLWKTNGRQIFGWAYHLSSAREVQKARLLLLDATGDTLAELPVKQGLAQGDFPAETRFLQLVTADDRVILQHKSGNMDWSANQGHTWLNSEMLKNGISPADKATPLVYLFSDRSLYRPGETAHVKGIIRWVKDNKISLPEVESITAELKYRYETVATLPVKLEPDGSFTVDAPMKMVGDHAIAFKIVYKGDASGESPDEKFLGGKEINGYYLDRTESIYLPCKEFRRNEFEVKSRIVADDKTRTVQVEAAATNFTTTPVAHGKVKWSLLREQRHFQPAQQQWSGFRFGDYTNDPWGYGEDEAQGRSFSESQSGELDAGGKGTASFTLPASDNPACLHLVATTTVTNGNEQSIRSVQEQVLHPASVYGGIRPESVLAQAGGKLPVELVAVKPDGSAWNGEPLEAEITVKRTVFRPYRYGSVFKSAVRNVEEETPVTRIPVRLTGSPRKLDVPMGGAGRYDVELRGRDAEGREFYSATRHYVWGDDVSPWEYLNDSELKLVPDKGKYRPGEMARILVQTPVDAELLVTVERGRVLRHYRKTVTVENPVIELPLESGDAPGVYVSVSLVQNGGGRGADGKPLQKLGTCLVQVEAVEKQLQVQLQAPQQKLLPGEACAVSGVITDAAGNPVANADVTLFAEDEGTLQVMGYKLPDPANLFYSMRGRDHCVGTYSALGQLVSENLGSRYFGNKGVFIGGGGDDEDEPAVTDSEAEQMRRNFTPCALWLSSVRTDAQGRFTATYANPDTLTRYRLMAVASAGDKFGSGEAAYHVTKPVMLEPAAPLSATVGDELLVPVTVSMLPEDLPEAANGKPVTWRVELRARNAEVDDEVQTVKLRGKEPVTLHFPLEMKRPGNVVLQYVVQAEDSVPGSILSRCGDAVQLSFEVVPPTPYIRTGFHAVIQPGQTGNLGQWLRGDYRPESKVEVSFSTSPLAGIAYPLQYLFTYPYGCSEQLSSTVIPWIFREELESALGIRFPETEDTRAVLAEVDEKLKLRRRDDGAYAYWDGQADASHFSPYVVMVRQMIGLSRDEFGDRRALRRNVQEDKNNPFMSMLALALCDKLNSEDFETLLSREQKRRKAASAQEQWTLALCARLLNHKQAAALKKKAQAAKASRYEDYHLPPVRALQCLLAVAEAPKSTATAQMLRRYVLDEAGRSSTWRNAWMVLSISRYVKAAKQKEIKAVLNGEELAAGAPHQYSLLASSTMVPFKAEKNPVYVYGQAEGFLRNTQPEQVVDNGFAVQRRYEALQADGSWKPTAEFRVGDVVRVTLSAESTSGERNLSYVVLEDRLPSTFEAVDPELVSQALPEGVSLDAARQWWNFTAVSHREFLKDRVRVFVDNWSNRSKLEVSYVARVVRSGEVTAPAAKAELMYRPEVHGLSIPQELEVDAR